MSPFLDLINAMEVECLWRLGKIGGRTLGIVQRNECFTCCPFDVRLFTHEMFSCLTPSTALLGKVCQYAPMAFASPVNGSAIAPPLSLC